MKTFASAILAAAVSANYCYSDGCNCNGETRACYSVPRQNMRPQAINTCCPVGVQPTVYGINNGRSINITPVTSSLAKACAKQMKADFNCSTIKTKDARKQCEKDKGDARKACEKGDADTRKESEKTAADERKESEKADAEDRKNTEKASADARKESEIADAEDRKNTEKASADARKAAMQTNLMEMAAGASLDIHSNLCSVGKNCKAYFQETGRWALGCCKIAYKNPKAVDEEAKTGLTLSNFVDCRDYSLYCCQEWNRFEWECITQDLPASSTNCQDVTVAAKKAGITADYPGTCNQTDSLQKDGNWNNNEFTGANVQTGGNTNCGKNCGITVNVNSLSAVQTARLAVDAGNGNCVSGINITTGGNTNCIYDCGKTINVNMNISCVDTRWQYAERCDNSCESDCTCNSNRICKNKQCQAM